jgi:hypothetical protein
VLSLLMVVDDGRGREDVCLTKSPSLREPSANVKGVITHDTGVVDVSLASRPGGVFNYDSVCILLNECLQDVSSAILSMLCLFAMLLCFSFFSVSVVGYEID